MSTIATLERGSSFQLPINPSLISSVTLFLLTLSLLAYGYLVVSSAVSVSVLKGVERDIAVLQADIASLETKAVSLENIGYDAVLASGYVAAPEKIFISNEETAVARR